MLQTIEALGALARHHPHAALDAHAWLGEAIRADAAAGIFDAWGRSTVVDENLGAAVIEEPLFDALHARAGLTATWPEGNAGLLHVYGYLLSTVMTPYGLKRDRWLDGQLARACGLPSEAFAPWAGERTLLDRVTEAAAHMIERCAVRTQHLDGARAIVAVHPDAGPGAVAYAIASSATAAPRLVTIFPVADTAQALARIDAEPARLRWNALLG
ncbi:amino acid deaminase [Microbacterium sp. BWT-B31]|uniref:amino acid deaminase n=1 Tax=Microbacterium sp. BWT-B31 TaxID=3232072 RepID=UPI0035283173